jgi:hypothetical protein
MISATYQRNYNMDMITKRLSYNRDSYELSVSPVTINIHNIHLNFTHRETGRITKAMLLDVNGVFNIMFSADPFSIRQLDNIFNTGESGVLDKQITDSIKAIENQFKFISSFLFGTRMHSIKNNYDSVDFKINNPADILTYSKELKPFMPSNCLDVNINLNIMMTPDYSGLSFKYVTKAKIDSDFYSGDVTEVIGELVENYACKPLNKPIEDLLLRDHVLLEMLKI